MAPVVTSRQLARSAICEPHGEAAGSVAEALGKLLSQGGARLRILRALETMAIDWESLSDRHGDLALTSFDDGRF